MGFCDIAQDRPWWANHQQPVDAVVVGGIGKGALRKLAMDILDDESAMILAITVTHATLKTL